MASYVKINDFVLHKAEGVHDLGSDQLMCALSNTAPGDETNDPTADGNGVLANVTEIAYTNLDGENPRNITTTSSAQTGGTYKLTLTDLTLTADGGSVGPFQYVYIYNDGPTDPANPLICYHARTAETTLEDGDKLTLDFDDIEGLLQVA